MQPLSIGLCTWSIDRENVIAAIEAAKRQLGVAVVHVGFFTEATLATADAAKIRAAAATAGVEISATFVGFEHVDRTSIASAERTGGMMPDELHETRAAMIERAASLSAAMGVPMLTTHLGAVPADRSSSAYATFLDRVKRAADVVGKHNVKLLAETGQEPPERLAEFIQAVDRPNVGVNFDPGNSMIYGNGDPVAAVTTLADKIMHVHLKDAARSAKPGQDWGREVPLGTGDANPARVVSKLRAKGYAGPLLIERRIAEGDTQDIIAKRLRDDIDYLRSMLT